MSRKGPYRYGQEQSLREDLVRREQFLTWVLVGIWSLETTSTVKDVPG